MQKPATTNYDKLRKKLAIITRFGDIIEKKNRNENHRQKKLYYYHHHEKNRELLE